ncbi:amino acid permease [Tissierella carlieri]|uniref:Amino acid permease n=1 Tax=Tissierella carlieri TaxID=689904 RepID=A0ABT1SBL5_9FIRM|nr:amino acid permease [Tissierella carlieri]MCQ4923877.1 amino acid permease [Tissierella carlieri]MDU5082352.1 amino acid permease [Bacillota bacterium]
MSKEPKKDVEDILEKSEGLQRSMKTHQIMMLGIGGTIGTGLFLGSGYVLQQAGPGGTLIAYLFGAIIMYLMMFCLGELLVEMPVAGTVQAYATELINPSMGFTVGWVKWLSYAITIPSQLVASSIIMKNIFPNVNSMIWIIGFTILLFIMNAVPSDKYGKSSFIFSSIKFILIVVFLILGLGMITGLVGKEAVGFRNFVNDGGLFPNGAKAVIMTMMTAAFAYGGADIFAAAASESENPEKDLPRAIHATIWGLIIAYIASLVVLIAVLPWRSADLAGSPFAYVFKLAGIQSAELIVNVVVLTSALSSANAFIYSSTRSLWSMGNFNQAPKFVSKVNSKKVPMNALIVTMLFAVAAVISSIVAPGTVYLFLTSIIGISNIFIYILYAVCLFIFRKQYKEKGGNIENIKFKTPFYPVTPALLIALCIILFIGMFFDPTQKLALILGIPTYAAFYIGSTLYNKSKKQGL